MLKVGEKSDEVNEKKELQMPSMLHELLLRKALFWGEGGGWGVGRVERGLCPASVMHSRLGLLNSS